MVSDFKLCKSMTQTRAITYYYALFKVFSPEVFVEYSGQSLIMRAVERGLACMRCILVHSV